MSASSRLTTLGLPEVQLVPYGLHACHFYSDAPELEELLCGYFAAGLRNREYCIWVTADPIDGARARALLQQAGFDVDAEERSGALFIVDHSDWYSGYSDPKGAEVVKRWLAEEARAITHGFNGLRITGNPTFLTDATWPDFMAYEKAIDAALHGHRILALCTYRRAVGPSNMLDVARRHDCALERRDSVWEVLSSGTGSLVPPTT
jgi:two-component system, sensor histidine kinase PdtaS